MFRYLTVPAIGALLLLGADISPATAQPPSSYLWNAAQWARLMPTAAQLPSGYVHDTTPSGRFPFITAQVLGQCTTHPRRCARSPRYVVGQVLGGQNGDLALVSGFEGGARTLAIGPGYQPGTNIPLTTPQVWVAMALFAGIDQARTVLRALAVSAPQYIKSESVEYRDDLGTPPRLDDPESVPAMYGTIHAAQPNGTELTYQYLTFMRGPIVVEISMLNPDITTVFRLGRIIDANLVEGGEQ